MQNTLKLLERQDKWYLGQGGKIIWTPPFPVYLDKIGFWDKANYYNFDLEPIFTVSVLDEKGKELNYKFIDRIWTPAYLSQKYSIIGNNLNIEIHEDKVVSKDDRLVSTIKLINKTGKKTRLNLIAWTVQHSNPSNNGRYLNDIEYNKEIIFVQNIRSIPYKEGKLKQPVRLKCQFGSDKKIKSYSINLAESSKIQPEFKFTPFYESFKNLLPNEVKTLGVDGDGNIFFGFHIEIVLNPKSSENCSFYFKINDLEHVQTPRIDMSQHSTVSIYTKEESVYDWTRFVSTIPQFECSDEFLTKYYWYRWYGLRLLTIPPKGNIKYPAIGEGISYFRAPITYSAQCHILETRWMHSPEIAQGSLLNWIENQLPNGSFNGYLDFGFIREEMFYHANWGRVLNELNQIHNDKGFISRIYSKLEKYVEYFDRERDREHSGLYDIINHFETGQEYMNRYIAVNPESDKQHWGDVFRLKGVDVTVYIYELKKLLMKIAEILEKQSDLKRWWIDILKTKKNVLSKMWDSDSEMFYDLNCKDMKKTYVKAATCFYPYFTDIVSKQHLNGIYRHLLNQNEFWTDYPVPSSSKDDKYYSAFAEWKGKRHSCPWNGRVWPMTNSHIAEALGYSAINLDGKLKKYTVEFINRYIRMMFHDGDIRYPNCFEHYNPENGKACIYRGVDDYQHSWVNDLIIKYVSGIQFDDENIIINPFPFNLKFVNLNNLKIREKMYSLKIEDNTYFLYHNDKLLISNKVGKPGKVQY